MACEWIGFCSLSNSEQAAWVQAVGSVFAVFVAIMVVFFQHRTALRIREEDAEDRRQRDLVVKMSLASRVYKHLLVYSAAAKRIKVDYISRDKSVQWPGSWPSVPQGLYDEAASLYLMGDIGADLTRAIFNSQEMRRMVSGKSLDVDDEVRFEHCLECLDVSLDSAVAKVRVLLGGLID